MSLAKVIEAHLPQTIDLRHRLHRIPELRFQEHKTAAVIRAELDRLGIDHVDGVPGAETATIAWIGDPALPCIALRADIDGLPIEEQTGAPYASTHAGIMHACGHDGHSAMLMGAAAVLKQMQQELRICVKLIWQPAEEGGGGAEVLVRRGVLDGRIGPTVRAIFGLHGWPTLPVGIVSTRPGPLMASTDYFQVTMHGQGGHAAFPHLTRDPIVAAAEAIVALQSIASRETDPTDSIVVSVTQVRGGTADNVIPPACVFGGTVRTLVTQTRTAAREAIRRRVEGIAAATGCQAEMVWEPGYPPTDNDPDMADYVARIARQALGGQRYLPAARPAMSGEDFAYYLEKIPGCFFFIGACPDGCDTYPGLHSNRFDFPDDALATGIRMHAELALNFPA